MQIKHSILYNILEMLKMELEENQRFPFWLGINRLIERLNISPVKYNNDFSCLVVNIDNVDYQLAKKIIKNSKIVKKYVGCV